MASKSNSSRSRSRSPNQVRITRRYVNTKRHTVAYMVGGEKKTVAQTTKLARQGRIRGVRVVGKHVQSDIGDKPLSALPATMA